MLIAAIDSISHETTLFAAIWFLVGGFDDLLVDLIYALRTARVRLLSFESKERARRLSNEEISCGRIVVFVAAWDESQVIGSMLRTALGRFVHPDYAIYVGTYPNDPATIAVVEAVAADDARVRLVVGSAPGPTTKADCLNTLWRALLRDEADGIMYQMHHKRWRLAA